MGASKGKSRVIAALALHHLKTTKEEVYIVFPFESLKNRDYDQCKDLWKFAGLVDKTSMKRLNHVVGVDKIPP